MSAQQVNLLSADLLPDPLWLSGRRMVTWVIGVALALSIWSGLHVLTLPPLVEIADEAERQLARMQAAGGPVLTAGRLAEEIAELNFERQRQEQVLSALSMSAGPSFSSFLQGLGAAKVRGVWLEYIELQQLPEATLVNLSGRALDAAYLPELLTELGGESVFESYQFTDIDVTRDERVAGQLHAQMLQQQQVLYAWPDQLALMRERETLRQLIDSAEGRINT